MHCRKPPEAVLLALLKRKAAGRLEIGRKEMIYVDAEPDTRNLMELPPDFDPAAPADLVVVNARLRDREALQTIVVSGNLITHVGPYEQLRKLISDKTEVIDAAGNTLLPGFTDSHYLRAEHGTVAYGFAPVFSTPLDVYLDGMHGADEAIDVADLAEMTRFNLRAIRSLS